MIRYIDQVIERGMAEEREDRILRWYMSREQVGGRWLRTYVVVMRG